MIQKNFEKQRGFQKSPSVAKELKNVTVEEEKKHGGGGGGGVTPTPKTNVNKAATALSCKKSSQTVIEYFSAIEAFVIKN